MKMYRFITILLAILLAQFDCREGVSAGDRASAEAALSTLACTALP